MRVILRLLLIACVVLLSVAGCQQQPATDPYLQLSGQTMGTTWSVALRSSNAPDAAGIKAGLQERLDGINALMSTYDPSSEISRFNQFSGNDWFPVSEDTARVVALALEISRLTDGAFDVSVGPLVELWGFGALPRKSLPPTAEQIAEVLAAVGYENLQLRRDPAAIRKKNPQLRIDFAAIAKGYAVDLLAHYLDQLQIEHYLVEIGGELKMRGVRSDGSPWRIAIEQPLDSSRKVAAIFPLTDIALATSGNYRNYYEENGRRYVHTIDPVSGKPIQHQLASATVLDPLAARADALATALMVMGEHRGRQFCEEHQIAAYFIIHHNTETTSYSSPAFQGLLEQR
ncbi:MAG: FAD:protein FMN transferase [Desulfuromonadales bacterium]|nr:FAD:protein FMN transferase [Desulfuromonadales bacterium]